MGGIRIQLPEKLERGFREAAMRRFGYGKGALSKAAEDAFERWLSATEKKFKGDPVKAIEGLLKDVEADSVDLQHSAKKHWVKDFGPH